MSNKDFYKEYCSKANAYNYALNSMYFSLATIEPKDGVPFANEMFSILAGESFEYETNSESVEKLEELYKELDPTSIEHKELELRLKNLHKISKLPKAFFVEFQQAVAASQAAWEEAKASNDYSIFKPHLINLIKLQKESIQYTKEDCESDYDHLLSNYENGMNTKEYDKFFQLIKDKLVPFIKRVQSEGKQIDDSLLFQNFDVEKQKQFTNIVTDYLEMDPNKCYLTESTHPFTSFFSGKESRLTTKYLKDNVMSAILSTMHEYGHAQYGLQIKEEYQDSALSSQIGFAMHESQSRLIENHIGRSKAFWKLHYPILKALYPKEFSGVDFDNFYHMINVTRSSLIRIEADELTYPLHILIRYELEKEMFDGNLDVQNLDTLWDEKYKEYLGVSANHAGEGILQDMHWSAANFGYFPTYALGSAFSAQFFNQMQKDMDVDSLMQNREYKKIANWLKEKIHQYGASKSFNEILLNVSNEEFNPNYYIDYLIEKYSELYNL